MQMNEARIGGMANDPIGKVQQEVRKVAGRMAQQAKSLYQQLFGQTWNVVGDIGDVTEGARRRN